MSFAGCMLQDLFAPYAEFYNGFCQLVSRNKALVMAEDSGDVCPAQLFASRPTVMTKFQLQVQLELDFTASSFAIV